MKKIILLVIVALFSFTIVEASETSVSTTNSTNTEVTAEAPVYWSGRAHNSGSSSLYIKVYRSPNMCDSFYAVILTYTVGPFTYDVNEDVVVKEASDSNSYTHYVVYKGSKFYFTMN